VEQVEDARAIFLVGRIERLDRASCVSEQRLVFRQRLRRGIVKIGQQGKKQIGIAITEIADLQGFEQIVDVLQTGQQGGHDHHGAMVVRDPF